MMEPLLKALEVCISLLATSKLIHEVLELAHHVHKVVRRWRA